MAFNIVALLWAVVALSGPASAFFHAPSQTPRTLRHWAVHHSSSSSSSSSSNGAADSTSSVAAAAAAPLDRRTALGQAGAAGAAVIGMSLPRDAEAIGPVNLDLENLKYSEVECPPDLAAGRIGGAFGGTAAKNVNQACVKVTATVQNSGRGAKKLSQVAVFGFVVDPVLGASVIANNPDMRSDAGQFAQIDEIGVGEDVPISFIFVATVGKDQNGKLPALEFRSVRAISYPGGARFEGLSPCELDSLSPECDEVSDEDRDALRKKKMRY